MPSLSSLMRIVAVLPLVVLLIGCQTTTAGSGYYTDDQRIADSVRAKLASDPALSRVGVISRNGVVYLTGTADSPERAALAVQLARDTLGVRQVVNQMQVASAAPPAVTVINPTVATAPPTTIFPGHPPIDVTGTVAAYDSQTRIVTLQDGRVVRLGAGTVVWQPAPVDVIRPGQHIYAHNAEPIGMQPSSAATQNGWWRMGVVERVDTASGLLTLRDGSVVRITPSTPLTMNGQPIALSQVRPGTQVAVRMPVTAATPAGSTTGGYALPGAATVPPSSSVILVFPEPMSR